MTSHKTGSVVGTRIGSEVIAQSFQILQAQTTGGGSYDLRLCKLPGSAQLPLAYSVRAIVQTQFADAVSSTISIGTAQGGTQLINAQNIQTLGANIVPANLFTVTEADVDIWVRITRSGTPGSGGKVIVVVEPLEINIIQPNNQGA